LVDISKTQDDEVGDGTTSVCVLTGELLREAEKLMFQKIHPQTIIEGEPHPQNFLRLQNVRLY
jgi:T-complex protein 1 subunit beta